MEKFKLSRSAERELAAGTAILSSFCVRVKRSDPQERRPKKIKFEPKEMKFEELTWSQMRERSHLSEGSLSKYVKILILREYLKGETRVVNNRLVTRWSLVRPELGSSYVVSERDTAGELPIGLWKTKPPLKKPIGGRRILMQLGIKRHSRKVGKGSKKIVFRRTRVLELKPPEDES